MCGTKGKLYDAIREIGVQHFHGKELEIVTSVEEAYEAENFYIFLFNSIENGYNAIYNGQSKADPFKNQMITMYAEGKSKLEIDRTFNFHPGTTKDRFRRWGIPPRKKVLIAKSLQGTFIKEFDTIDDARKELFPEKQLATVKSYISKAANHGTPAYRFMWEWQIQG